MKLFTLTILLAFSINLGAIAQTVGCRIGNYILIMPTGGYTQFNPGDKFPLYSTAGQIAKRNWDQDPQCGILRTTADNYPVAPGGNNNPNSLCSPNNNPGDYGKLVYYKNSDNTCKTTTNAPFDAYTFLLAIIISGVSVHFIRKASDLKLTKLR